MRKAAPVFSFKRIRPSNTRHRYCPVRSRDNSWLGDFVCLGEVLCFCHRCNDDGRVTENECTDRINDAVNETGPFLKITRAVSSGAAASRAAQAESRRRAGGHVALDQKSRTILQGVFLRPAQDLRGTKSPPASEQRSDARSSRPCRAPRDTESITRNIRLAKGTPLGE